jgi:hypothetical protein
MIHCSIHLLGIINYRDNFTSFLTNFSKKSNHSCSWALPEKLPIVQPFRKFPAILWNPKVHYRVHKSPPLVPILSHIDSVHTIPSYLSKRSILILSTHLRLGLPSGIFPSGFPNNILYMHSSSSPFPATCPPPSLAHYIWRRIQDMQSFISQRMHK